MDVAFAIRAAAHKRGLRQADLCRMTGIPSGYMSSLWNGKIRDPQLSKMRLVVRALEMSFDEFCALADKGPKA